MLLRVLTLKEGYNRLVYFNSLAILLLIVFMPMNGTSQVPPTLDNVPANITIQCTDNAPGDPGTVTASDDCVDTPTIDFEQVVNLSCANEGFITNIWTATDCDGLMTTEAQIVRIIDNIPPVPPNAPGDLIVSCPDMVPTPQEMTATDNCSTDITVAPVDSYVPTTDPTCVGQRTIITRTWTFVDECDNETSIRQRITVNALIEPQFNESPLPQDLQLDCGDVIPTKAVLTVMDGCGNMLNVMCSEERIDGVCSSSYALVRRWNANDCAGNAISHMQTITILDQTPPTVVCQDITVDMGPDGEVTIDAEDLVDSFSDDCSTVSFSVNEDNFNCFEIGDNEVTLTAEDACGNEFECDVTVTVEDNSSPTCDAQDAILCLGSDGTLTLVPADLSVVSEDNCSVESVTFSPAVLTCDDLGANTIDITVTDVNGQVTMCSADITLEDCRSPILSCDAVSVEITDPTMCSVQVTWELPVISNLCPSLFNPPVQISGPMSGDFLEPGFYTATYQTVTANNATAVCNVDITVLEYQPNGLICRNVNVSLNESCQSQVTPLMVLGNAEIGCEDHYEIEVTDPHGNNIGNLLDDTFLGAQLTYRICQRVSGLCCWGNLIIEDKFPPELECDAIVVSACNGLASVPTPEADENCSVAEVILINEEYENRACDPDYVALVTRTYVARDQTGNESAPCVQEIYLERPDITDIIFPPSTEIFCDEIVATTPEGYPAPSETGVPTNEDGDPFFPDVPDQFCNTFVTFSDEEVATTSCKVKIQRTWEIREWWCTGELTFGGVQIIEILDETGPVIVMPDDMTATTKYECEAEVMIPSITATDACGTISGYSIEYPGGVLNTNGGRVDLEIGENIITYTVFDDCYNSSTDQMTIVVADETQPVAACEQNTVVSIPRQGWVEVLAEVFDDGSWDDCGLHSYEVRRMDTLCNPNDTLFGPSVEFCCADLVEEVMVALRVTDYAGNTNICMVNVHVQDKILPRLTCPPDTIIECTFPYDINNLGLNFGNATVDVNCALANVEEEINEELNQCGLGQIGRRFYIGDRDNPVTECTQWITVVNNNPFNPGSIDWPDNYETTDECTIANLTPEALSYPFDMPVWTDDICDLIGTNYEDEIFDFTETSEACVKIIRTWTMINWCQRDLDGNYITWEYEQELKLNNTVDPVITGDCPDELVCSFDIQCNPIPVRLFREATDDCTPEDLLSWSYQVDLDSDGDIDDFGFTNDTTIVYPLGVHTVFWIVQDLCGNQERCDHILEIRSCTAPTPVCIQGLSVDLVPMDTIGNDGFPDAEMATIWASDFDASSFHSCGNGFTFSFSQDTTDKSIVYDCEDIGINVVTMWVTDVLTGAQDFCQTFIDVQDNNDVDVCPDVSTIQPRIAGSISTEMNDYVENVMVELMGSELSPETTDGTGGYAFEPNIGREYEVDPYKNDDPLNGVSTLDLVLIQRHILGSRRLDSPYKLIAADVNKDEAVSSVDLIELRKLILGIYDAYPQNESWRFVNADYEFADIENPWINDIEESYETGVFLDDMTASFVGVKIGDVNNDVESNFNSIDVESRQLSSIYFEFSKINDQQVALVSKQDLDLTGIQFTIEHPNVDIQTITSNVFDLNEDNYGLFDNKTTVSLHSEREAFIQKGDVLLTLDVYKNSSTNYGFGISSSITKAEAYNSGFDIKKVEHAVSETGDAFVLYQNIPNPWKESTVISFELARKADLSFVFYNTVGAKLYEFNSTFDKGYNTFEITANDLQTNGLIFYEVVVDGKKFNKKMILLN